METSAIWIKTAVSICLGLSLSACAGLRAFLPLLALSVLVKLGYIHVSQSFVWIGSAPALITFSVATLAEILADKIPAVDNFLDSAGLFIKPVAGTVLFSTVIIKMDPLLAVVLGIIAGGSVSELIHVKKAALRAASSGLTLGFANPIISALEDFTTAVAVALSFVMPVLAAILILIGIYLSFRFIKKLIEKKKRESRESKAAPAKNPA